MPAEERIGLDNEERLFPRADDPCQQDQADPLRPSASWALDLTTENDELLSQQRVFGDEFRSGTGQIDERSAHQ